MNISAELKDKPGLQAGGLSLSGGGHRLKAAHLSAGRRSRLMFLVFVVLLFLSMAASVCIGAVEIAPADLWSIIKYKLGISDVRAFQPQQELVFMKLRLPRVIMGALVGAGLAISGASMQGLFRNPLAEPGLIGISGGASLFAVLTIVLGGKYFPVILNYFGYYALSVSAFIGACITTASVYFISVYRGRAVISTLLLAGIAINSLTGAITGLMTYISTDEQLRNITFWSLGSLGGANWSSVQVLTPFVVLPLLSLPVLAKALNALALGESQAGHMGINVSLIKRLVIVLSTMTVGASVAMCGMIGFVGLVVPHIIRRLGSSSHYVVLPCAALLGASVLSLADLAARTIVIPAELPIGILTALIGVPVFIYIIFRERRASNL